MEEMTESGTILLYILLYTSFVTNNYQVLRCYVIDYFMYLVAVYGRCM